MCALFELNHYCFWLYLTLKLSYLNVCHDNRNLFNFLVGGPSSNKKMILFWCKGLWNWEGGGQKYLRIVKQGINWQKINSKSSTCFKTLSDFGEQLHKRFENLKKVINVEYPYYAQVKYSSHLPSPWWDIFKQVLLPPPLPLVRHL